MALLFDKVHTIELVDHVFADTKKDLSKFSNVECHLGSSEKKLQQILPALKEQRLLFYLDAHWGEPCPLYGELLTIAQTHKDNCIIVIDDFKVPRRADIPYDSYNNMECSFECIKGYLNEVYTSYDYYYVIPRNIFSRAKFVAIPKNWK